MPNETKMNSYKNFIKSNFRIIQVVEKGVVFENPVSWGIDLASQHERYLCDHVYFRPVIIYNYPKDIKAFYMRANDDGKTVAAFDILAPEVG